nr:Gag-Pol polyprotein [Tanacetum cinerariifolium]
MFDEYLEPPRVERPVHPTQAVQAPVNSAVEPKNFKAAMDDACWFEAMQEEIYEFDQLQVWELVPKPDCVMVIALVDLQSQA